MSRLLALLLLASSPWLCNGFSHTNLDQPEGSASFIQKVAHHNIAARGHGMKLTSASNDFLTIHGNGKETAPKKDGIREIEVIAQVVGAVCYFIQICFMIGFAFLYKSKVVDLLPRLEPQQAGSRGSDFKNGLCDCWGDQNLCLHTMCCFPCRTAHTWSVTGAMDYVIAIVLQVLLGPCFICVGIYMRGKVRATVGLEPQCCDDCLKMSFCTLCAIGQEALEVDELSGVNIVCCFNVMRVSDTGAQARQPELAQPLAAAEVTAEPAAA